MSKRKVVTRGSNARAQAEGALQDGEEDHDLDLKPDEGGRGSKRKRKDNDGPSRGGAESHPSPVPQTVSPHVVAPAAPPVSHAPVAALPLVASKAAATSTVPPKAPAVTKYRPTTKVAGKFKTAPVDDEDDEDDAEEEEDEEEEEEEVGVEEDNSNNKHLEARKNDLIGGRFQIIEEMGTGTFGKVYRCRDHKHNDIVALKCIRSITKYIESAKVESKILSTIYRKQREMLQTGLLDKEYCVKLYTHVNHGLHYCMAFEPLGPSLLDVLKHNGFQGYPLSFVQYIGHQLCQALNFMSKIDLVHTDIKLENILFTNSEYMYYNDWKRLYEQDFYKRRFDVLPLRFPRTPAIKLIDFGGANYLPNGKTKTSIVNTRQYRGPEVTLELGWSFPSDMWSVGCMLAEIWTGELLFPTHDNLEHLRMMEVLIGPFPHRMKSQSPVRRTYFETNLEMRVNELSAHSRKKVSGRPTLTSLTPDLFAAHKGQVKPEDGGADIPGEGFVELLQSLLRLDPRERILPRQAVEHNFFRNKQQLPQGISQYW